MSSMGQFGQFGLLSKKAFGCAFYKFFKRNPHLFGLLEVRRSRSLTELADYFNVDVVTVLLALGYLRKGGFIKDVRFI